MSHEVDLAKLSKLTSQSMANIPNSPPNDKKPGCLDQLQGFALRCLTLLAIISLAMCMGAFITVAFVPPVIQVNTPPVVVITASPVVITETVQVIVTAEPVVITQVVTITPTIISLRTIFTPTLSGIKVNEPINFKGITITLQSYSNEVFISFNQQTYMFSLQSALMGKNGEFGLIIKNDFKTKKSIFIFASHSGLKTLPQVTELATINEIVTQFIGEYAEFEIVEEE